MEPSPSDAAVVARSLTEPASFGVIFDRPAAPRGRIVVRCEGTVGGAPPAQAPPRGRCDVSGAITGRGRFADDRLLLDDPHLRIVSLPFGTIRFSVYRERGSWRIVGGTKAYAGLRGRGWESPTGQCPGPIPCLISLTMVGTVFRWRGTV
jgi:hypothetical protein